RVDRSPLAPGGSAPGPRGHAPPRGRADARSRRRPAGCSSPQGGLARRSPRLRPQRPPSTVPSSCPSLLIRCGAPVAEVAPTQLVCLSQVRSGAENSETARAPNRSLTPFACARGHRWSPRVGVVDSVEVFGEQRGRQVALTEVGEDDDDALAGVLLTRGDGLGGRECGTGGDAHEQALLLRDLTGPVEGGVVVDGDDLV